ncbi:MAG: MBL fold metallo-hydrolase, partial [Spirochaetia bacterium]|nr:MBL fold metallo-hydrolase [Spirochaetia bacterium]
MIVKLWGVRGSIPAPMSEADYRDDMLHILSEAKNLWNEDPSLKEEDIFEKLPYNLKRPVGGETTCVEVRHEDTVLILDMGSGARRLGMDLMARKFEGDLNILITHTHWDHIQGWPFFIPGYIPERTVKF